MHTYVRYNVLVVLLCLFLPLQIAVSQSIQLHKIGTYHTGIFDDAAAEISAYDAASQRVFVTNAANNALDVIDISDPTAPSLVQSIDLAAYGDGPNSVDASNGVIAVAVQADPKTDPGSVVFFDADGNELGVVVAGALPDMLSFSPDGSLVLVANEGEPNDDYTIDPEGSLTLIDISSGVAGATATHMGFEAFNAGGALESELPEGVRIFGPGATVSQDLEPEYVAFDPNRPLAIAVLQENNAVAVVDLAAGEVAGILDLGTKDHSLPENALDASNRDDAINITTWPVLGFYMPDAIKAFDVGGETYFVTANEGDARDYDGYSEEERVGGLTLDPDVFPNAADLQDDANLGRLNSTTANGDTDGDGDVDVIYSYGARSFSIWDGNGGLVFDSGSMIEEKLAELHPNDFNANNDENDSFDSRSDDKGPEPEAVEVATIDGVTYVFVGLERIGGIMTFDISNPAAPVYVDYVNTRDFSIIFDPDTITPDELEMVGDLAPEDIQYISASESPNGQDLLLVANEVSGTVSIFSTQPPASEPMTLTILHNNDGESQLVSAPGLEDFGGAARFKTLVDQLRAEAGENAVMLSSGDNFLAGPEFNASLELSDTEKLYESRALELIGYDALAIGNHEFDFGPDVLERLIADFDAPTPFLSANLDFSGEAGLQALVDAGRIAASTVIERSGQMIGVVGATTPNLPFIASPRNVTVNAEVAASVQGEIDKLEAMGVNKIILISHLQGVEEDLSLLSELSGVDIVIAGGGDELLANDDDLLVPGDEDGVFGEYPLLGTSIDGVEVPVVTTAGNYKYVGRLIVDFDAEGNLTGVSDESGPVRVAGGAEADAVEADTEMTTQVTEPIVAALADLEANIIGTSEVALDGVRGNIRSIETNLGNLITDAFLWQGAELADAFGVPAPDVAIANGGGIRNDNVIAAGEISELTTFDILPFSNFITVFPELPAAQFKEVLENAVSRIGAGGGTGRFAQLGGVSIVYDPEATAMEIDDEGNVIVVGNRIVSAVLDDGRVIVANGSVVAGAPAISLATVDFLARGGDQYPYRDTPFTVMGVTYQQALANFIQDGLAGTIAAADYPEGGEGRITTGTQVESGITFTLIDSDTDAPVAGYDPIANGATLNLSGLPVGLNIRANAGDEAGMVVFSLNDDAEFHKERVAPYSMFGDREGDYAAGRLPVGTHTMGATASATGEQGSVTFSVVSGGSNAVNGLFVVNAETGEEFTALTNGAAIDGSSLPEGVNLVAKVGDDVKSVMFDLNSGFYQRIENVAPFALFGDISGSYLAGSLPNGEHTLVVTPYSQVRTGGDAGTSLTVTFTVSGAAAKAGLASGRFEEEVQEVASTLPEAYTLNGNYPNPFNPETTLSFTLPETSNVQLFVYDTLGRRVATLIDGAMAAGVHEVRFDASNLPGGTYFYNLVAGEHNFTKTMVLLK